MKEAVQVHSREQLFRYAHVNAHGDVSLKPNHVYILHTPITVKSLYVTGDTEIRGVRKQPASLTLTKAGAGISSNHLDKLTLRHLKLSSGTKTSLFDLKGDSVSINECVFNARHLGRINLQSLGMHGIHIDQMLQGLSIRNLNDLNMKYMTVRNSSGALLDLSTAKLGSAIKLKRIRVGESFKDHFELLRLETHIGKDIYRPEFTSEEEKVIQIEDAHLSVKSINSYRTILESRDKLITGFKYTGQGSTDGYILQPCTDMRRRVSLLNVSTLSP